jgi:hypothetical protein
MLVRVLSPTYCMILVRQVSLFVQERSQDPSCAAGPLTTTGLGCPLLLDWRRNSEFLRREGRAEVKIRATWQPASHCGSFLWTLQLSSICLSPLGVALWPPQLCWNGLSYLFISLCPPHLLPILGSPYACAALVREIILTVQVSHKWDPFLPFMNCRTRRQLTSLPNAQSWMSE